MRFKQGICAGVVMITAMAVLTSCGGPEQKKAKFYNRGKALYEKGEYAKAKLEFRNAIQIDAGYADAYYMLGMAALKARDQKGAYGSFSKAIELSPGHLGAQAELGKFLLAAGETDKAMDKVDLILKADPRNEDALIMRGAALLKRKDIEGARRSLEPVVDGVVRKPDGYLLLASIYAQKGDARSVEKTLREGIKANGSSVPLYIALADLCVRERRLEDAAGLMQKAVELEPDRAEHRLQLAAIYWDSGKGRQAEEVLERLLSSGAKEESWVYVSDFYNARKRPAEAESKLKEGIRLYNRSFRIRFALSAFYLSTGRPGQGVSVLEECLGLDRDPANPNIILTKNSLAQFHLTRHDLDKAKRYVDEVIKVSPKNVDALYMDGAIHLKRGEALQAVTSLRTVINERPQFIPGYISLAEAHAMNRETDLAFDTVRNAYKIAPGSRELTLAMAGLYAGQKDFRNAESQYRRVINANPGDLEARADLGDMMFRAGDMKRAEAEYREIKRRAPDLPQGYVKLSAFFAARQKWDQAIAELERAVEIQPGVWSQMNDLAYMLGDYGNGKKDLDRALELARKADSLSPENPSVFDTMGWVHYKRGETKEAVEWLAKAQARAEANPVFNYHLGMAHYRAGDAGKAKEYLKKALSYKESFPGKDEAEKTVARLL